MNIAAASHFNETIAWDAEVTLPYSLTTLTLGGIAFELDGRNFTTTTPNTGLLRLRTQITVDGVVASSTSHNFHAAPSGVRGVGGLTRVSDAWHGGVNHVRATVFVTNEAFEGNGGWYGLTIGPVIVETRPWSDPPCRPREICTDD